MKFNFSNVDTLWSDSEQVAHLANSMSFLMEYLEPFVVEIVSNFKNQDPEYLRFIKEEKRHHGVHKVFNNQIKNSYSIWEIMSLIYLKIWGLTQKMNQKYQVGIVFAFEAFAVTSGCWINENKNRIFLDANEEVKKMFLWHFEEEQGHSNVSVSLAKKQNIGIAHKLLGLIFVWTNVIFAGLMFTLNGLKLKFWLYPKVIYLSLFFFFNVLPENILCLTHVWNPTKLANKRHTYPLS